MLAWPGFLAEVFKMIPEIRFTDSSGNVQLTSHFQNSTVLLEQHSKDEILIRRVKIHKGMDAPHSSVPDGSETVPLRIEVSSKGRIKLDGHVVTVFLKGLGHAEWSTDEARRLMAKLGKLTGHQELADLVHKGTIPAQVGDGNRMLRGERQHHPGDYAKLSPKLLAQLREFIAE